MLESLIELASSAARVALLEACNAAHEYAEGENADPEIVEAIEEQAGTIKGYLDAVNPPSDIRLQSYANALNAIVPD
jgi:hypothetical protein